MIGHSSPQLSSDVEFSVHGNYLAWSARILPSMASTDRNGWDRLFASACRGFDYFRACELSGSSDFKVFAVAVFAGDRLIAGVPAFETTIPVTILLEGMARNAAAAAGRWFPNAMSLPIVGLGSPYWEEVALVFDPDLDAEARRRATTLILDVLDGYAKQNGIGTLIAKNISDSERSLLDPSFQMAGYAPIEALPLTSLWVPPTDEAYIQSLSANMRSNMRRKLKKAKGLRMEIRTNVDGIEDDLHRMRTATTSRAKIDFEAFSQVPRGYYRSVLEQMRGKAYLRLYWFEEQLIGFALVLRGPREITETYTGMVYPEGPDHGLFFLNWMIHLKEARQLGMTVIDAGPTTYITKERLNCQFHRSWLFVRYRKRLGNWVLHSIADTIGFNKSDPDLKQLGDRAPYVQ